MRFFLEHNWGKVDGKQWERLVQGASDPAIFLTYGWHQALMSTIRRKAELFLVIAEGPEGIAGIAPLMIVRKGALRILKFIGTGRSDHGDLVYRRGDTAVLEGMLVFLMEQQHSWDAMALDLIPEGSMTINALRSAAASHGVYVVDYARSEAPSLVFDADRANVRAKIDHKFLGRPFNFFSQKGGYKVTHHREAADIRPYLDAFFKQHMERWSKKGAQSLFYDAQNQDFYKALVDRLSSSGSLVFTALHSNGVPIAFHFGLSHRKKLIWYKPSFDHALAKHSPGNVLIRELLLFAVEHGYDEFDFSLGREGFKERFSDHVRHYVSFKVFKSKRDLWLDKARGAVRGIFSK